MRCQYVYAIVLSTIFGSAPAYALEAKGTLDVIDCYSGELEVIEQSDQTLWLSWSQTGTRRSVDQGGPFDRMAARCVGFLWAREGAFKGHSACEFLDEDGDKVFVESARTGDAIAWEFAGGTGKYHGIEGEGSYTDYGYFPRLSPSTYQFCPQSSGTYRLPGEE